MFHSLRHFFCPGVFHRVGHSPYGTICSRSHTNHPSPWGYQAVQYAVSGRRALLLAACLLSALANWANAAEPPQQGSATEIDRLLTEDIFGRDPSCQLAPRANDEIFLRRIYLDLVGEQPSPNEVCAFVLDPSPDKRQKAIERLLADPRYGVNWSHYWRDVVMYRRANDQIAFFGNSMESYLVQQFNANTPWDQLARAFVEAKGDVQDNGQGGLYVAQLAEPVDVAAETSRIFLGIQIQCAQCHDHPTDRWKRQQFHEFAAFFPRVALTRARTKDRPSLTLASFDSGPLARRPGQMGQGGQEHFMPDLKDPTSQGTMMEPVFFATGQRLTKGVTDDQRRHSLADWMTSRDNPWFAKAFVNRTWAELVGEGFYEPIDDLGPERQCSAPQTMDYLARQFVEQGHDVKWLLRTIMATDAYQRESRPRRNADQLPFTANVAQPLRADQVYDVLVGVMGFSPDTPMAREAPAQGPRQPSGPRAQFNALFGYDPSTRRDDISRSIPQALMMMNSNLVERTVDTRQASSPFAQLLAREKDDEQVAVEVYLRCVAREPNDQELAVCLDHLRNTSNRNEAFEDIVWSLLNSKEFLSRR
jgi:hypothetical protein